MDTVPWTLDGTAVGTSISQRRRKGLTRASGQASRSALGATASSACLVLVPIVVFFGGMAVVLGLFVLFMQLNTHEWREAHPKKLLRTSQQALLIVLASCTIVATVALGIYVGVSDRSAPVLQGADATAASSRAADTSSAVQTTSIAQHNAKRALAPAVTMGALLWDAASANVAASYINTCPGLVHNSNRGTRGENIYVSSGVEDATTALTKAIAAWDAEKAYYNINTNACQAGKVCGHYTQLVWAATTGVGCAVNNACSGTWKTQVVCDYTPPGNYVGQKPFVYSAVSLESLMGPYSDLVNDYSYEAIVALSAKKYLIGCGVGKFCQSDPVLRHDFAEWMFLGVGSVIPMNLGPLPFVDVVKYGVAIDWMSRTGTTRGCSQSPAKFCGTDTVTRGQMAAFLHRAFGPYVKSLGTAVDFTDNRNKAMTFYGDIVWLSQTGITNGCSATQFCPDRTLSRREMATFLYRALKAAKLAGF